MAIFDKIPEHTISCFEFGSVRIENDEKYVKSYFHPIKDFLPSHKHGFYEINIICDGVGKHVFGSREILTRKGDVFVIPPNIEHGYSSSGSLTVYHILLSELFFARFSETLSEMRGYGLLFDLEPLLRSRIDGALYLKNSDIPFDVLKKYIDMIEECVLEGGFEAERCAHVLSLIAVLSRAMSQGRQIEADSFPRKQALTVIESMEYIDVHYAQKIDFRELASRGAVSYSTFLRRFKGLSGMTPAKYQLGCKIKAAANMLLATNESVLTVALENGFFDSSHFIREFIKEKGISPNEFRKKARVPKVRTVK